MGHFYCSLRYFIKTHLYCRLYFELYCALYCFKTLLLQPNVTAYFSYFDLCITDYRLIYNDMPLVNICLGFFHMTIRYHKETFNCKLNVEKQEDKNRSVVFKMFSHLFEEYFL